MKSIIINHGVLITDEGENIQRNGQMTNIQQDAWLADVLNSIEVNNLQLSSKGLVDDEEAKNQPRANRTVLIIHLSGLANDDNGKERLKPSTPKSSTPPYLVKDRIYVRDGMGFTRVLEQEILFIKGAGSYSEIHTTGKTFIPSINLARLKSRMPFAQLLRVHKSYVVNLEKVTSLKGNCIYIDDKEIPIGESYREAFLSRFRLI